MGRLGPRVLTLFLVMLYVGGLKVAYLYVIAPLYYYKGLSAIPSGAGPEILSWVFALLPREPRELGMGGGP